MPRQNEYFVPRDNIDREVISADICRYLGNDALVRPGFYENPQTGQNVEGYYITAYRNLTTAMIDDLKADSARWDSERRTQSRASSSLTQYRHSDIHMARQNHGPSEFYTDGSSAQSSGSAPRYPGSGAPGYTGATPTYQSQSSYPAAGGSGYPYPPNQQSPQLTAPRNPPHPQLNSAMNQAYPTNQDHPYIATGANNNPRFDPYARGAAAPPQPEYATQGSSQQGYPSHMQYANQVPPGVHGGMQPPEGYYGRASPAGQNPPMQAPGYTSQAQPQQQYDEIPVTRASAPPATKAQTPPGSIGRRSDRDSDRHASDRHHRSNRR